MCKRNLFVQVVEEFPVKSCTEGTRYKMVPSKTSIMTVLVLIYIYPSLTPTSF